MLRGIGVVVIVGSAGALLSAGAPAMAVAQAAGPPAPREQVRTRALVEDSGRTAVEESVLAMVVESVRAMVVEEVRALDRAEAGQKGRAGPRRGRGPWFFTGLSGVGLRFFDGEQVAEPTLGFGFGRPVNHHLEFEGRIVGMAGLARQSDLDTRRSDAQVSSYQRWEQVRHLFVASRLNYLIGKGRLRPYLSIGAGAGWGEEERESLSIVARPPDAVPEEHRYRRSSGGVGIVSLFGSGLDIRLNERWRVRPEATLPIIWGTFWSGNVTLAGGLTYTPGGSPTVDRRPPLQVPTAGEPRMPGDPEELRAGRERAGERGAARGGLDFLPGTLDDWRRVTALGPGGTLRVRLRRGFGLQSDDRILTSPGRHLLGRLVAANERELVLAVAQGAPQGTWRIAREAIERIELGRIERDGIWEGVLGGFAVAAGVGAIGYLSSRGGEDSEVWLSVAALLFGPPAAVIGGVSDYYHESFQRTRLIYEASK